MKEAAEKERQATGTELPKERSVRERGMGRSRQCAPELRKKAPGLSLSAGRSAKSSKLSMTPPRFLCDIVIFFITRIELIRGVLQSTSEINVGEHLTLDAI